MLRMVATTGRKSLFFPIILLLLVVLRRPLAFTGAYGEEKETWVLTLEEALRIAAEKNHDIQKAREYRNYVEAIYVQERAAVLPQFLITANATNAKDESQKALGPLMPLKSNTRSAEVGLSQALFTWGQVGAAIRAAKVGIATAEDQLRIFRQAAFRDVYASFYDILLAKELHAIAIPNLEHKGRHSDEAHKTHAAAAATDCDVLVG